MLFEFAALFDRSANPNVCFVFINGWDLLICQTMRQIQIIPGAFKLQNKGFKNQVNCSSLLEYKKALL